MKNAAKTGTENHPLSGAQSLRATEQTAEVRMLQLVVVEDDTGHFCLIQRAFLATRLPVDIRRAGTLEEYRHLIAGYTPDLALMDLNLPDGRATDALTLPAESGPFPIVVMTSHGSESTAVEAMKSGALDYVVKSSETFADMPRIVNRALREWNLLRERSAATAALQESEERYRRITETITDFIYTVELHDGRPVKKKYGTGCIAVTGYTAEELAADPWLWRTMLRDDEAPLVLEQTNKVLQERKAFTLDHRITCKDGSERWVRRTLVPNIGPGGAFDSYNGIMQDITARKRAEATLMESENKFRNLTGQFNALLNAMPDSITMHAPDLTVLWANRAACSFSKEPSALIGGRCYALWHKRATPCDRCSALTTVQSGEPSVETQTSPDGRIWELRTVPVKEEGRVVNVIVVGRDISEHKKLEAQLIQSQKMESIGILAGGIAHDFNNILTAIMGYGEVALLHMAEDDPHRRNIGCMLEGVDRAAYLTQGLLSFSRKQNFNKRRVDLGVIAQKFEKFLARVIGEDIQYRTEIPAAVLPVFVDANQIEQVLMNLATNARDAMTGGGILTIAVERVQIDKEFIALHGYGAAGTYGLITVSDTGTGMDAETRQKIFDPFFTTKEVGKGTGLGLSIIYGIIKEHSGYVNVYSEPGMGTTFRIYLPVIEEKGDEAEKTAVTHYPRRGTETILLAEDDESLRSLMTLVLREFGYTVLTAVDGNSAVCTFAENRDKIDLLLFDLIMPGKSGKTAYEEIRNTRPGVRAIFASGYPSEFLRQRELIADDVRLVTKPVSPTTLLNVIREELDRRGSDERGGSA